MRTTDQIQLVFAKKREDNLVAEDVTHSPLGLAPHLHRSIWIGPQQVAQQSSIGDIGWTHNSVDLVD